MPCGAGISQLAYSPDGSVYTCDEGRMFEEFRLGHVNQKFSDILKTDVLKGMVVTSSGFMNSCDSCVLKPFCGTCPLEAYKYQGDVVSKIPFDRRCKIHKGMIEYLLQRISNEPAFKKMLLSWTKSSGRVSTYDAGDIYSKG